MFRISGGVVRSPGNGLPLGDPPETVAAFAGPGRAVPPLVDDVAVAVTRRDPR
jgi:hypothetical protein